MQGFREWGVWFLTITKFTLLLMALGFTWPLCHAHRLAVPAFAALKLQAESVHEELRRLQDQKNKDQ